MSSDNWLFKMDEQRILNPITAWPVGVTIMLWLIPQRDGAGQLDWRLDGRLKGEPHDWSSGERVFIATTSGFCFADGTIVDPARWEDSSPEEPRERWEFTLDLAHCSFDRPVDVSRYGIRYRRGSRQPLSDFEAGALDRALHRSRSHRRYAA